MRELVPEARLNAIVLKVTTDEYQLVKLSATNYLDSTLEQMEATMRNVFVNDVSQDDCAIDVMGHAAMTAARADANHVRVSCSMPDTVYGKTEHHDELWWSKTKEGKGRKPGNSKASSKETTCCSLHQSTANADAEVRKENLRIGVCR